MAHSNGIARKPVNEMGPDLLASRFHGALSCESGNKPDFKELDLGSPISPLKPSTAAPSSTTLLTTTATSSSSSSGSVPGRVGSNPPVVQRSSGRNYSGELLGSFEGTSCARNPKPVHRRSKSSGSPLIFSGGSSANFQNGVNLLPSGNICPSGKIGKTGMACRSSPKSDVLGSGTGNYGHGNVMRGVGGGKMGAEVAGNIQCAGEAVMVKRAMASLDAEEVKRVGNEQYKRGHFAEALCLYDRAIAISPDNAACRSNRAAALMGLGRLEDAVRECEEAVKLDPAYERAHQRLASLYIRLGQVENARRHLFTCQQPDASELQKLQAVEMLLIKCADARRTRDWRNVMREGDAAITAGADSCPQLFVSRVEALLKLHQLEEANSALSNMSKFGPPPPSCLQTKFFGILCDSYPFFVRAQVEMALGRFENAIAAAEKAGQIDPKNVEVVLMLDNVKAVARARARGNDLFNAGKFVEACAAYGDGLKFDPSNPVLHCNRAACRSKLGQWERSIEDCNKALQIHPSYTKALLRRAASNDKLERWADSVRDYEVLQKELPGDKEVAEALFRAQVALKKSCGEEVHDMQFGGEVEVVMGVDQFRALISSPGVSVVHFMLGSNQQSKQISPFVDMLCARCPSVHFVRVDMDESPALAKAENVRIVPTFKIYKNGAQMKELICPSQKVLEQTVRHYSL